LQTSKRCKELVHFAQKCIKLHLQPSSFKKVSWGETPGPLITGMERRKSKGGEENKGFLPLREWVSLSSVLPLRPRQHSIVYMGDGFYRSKDPTNSIKVLKENLQRKVTKRTRKTQNTQNYTYA